MTILVGIRCSDGVVIGADSSATMAHGQLRTVEQPTKKIRIINDRVVVACSGAVGLAQRFCKVVEQAWNGNVFNSPPHDVGRELSRLAIQDFAYTHVQQLDLGALVAFPAQQHPHLCEFEYQKFQPELKTEEDIWYGSMGSGQPIVDPFLGLMRKIFWQDDTPNLQDAVFAATWALEHAIDVNPGGINAPLDIAILAGDPGQRGQLRARILDDGELQEHKQNVTAVEEHLRVFPRILRGEVEAGGPEVPTPEGQNGT